jgi:hypothetical protein
MMDIKVEDEVFHMTEGPHGPSCSCEQIEGFDWWNPIGNIGVGCPTPAVPLFDENRRRKFYIAVGICKDLRRH